MLSNPGHVMTLANGIIGVGILAMPFCFQKCGVILSILLLVISNLTTRISCHYLIKSSLLTRRKSFEFLAFHAFGPSGKLLAELCTIGYLIGTCIAYFVVVGDLGPQIIAKLFNVVGTEQLRIWVMITITALCVLPLGMLKNIDSLSTVCTASVGFYFCLVIKVICESKAHIFENDWTDNIEYWRPAGVLQCLPIFSMSLSCQMQIFEVFESINNQSLEKLNGIVRNATNICTLAYIAVGFFGYVAFCTQTFSGNILVNFTPSFGSDVIKIGFVVSVAFSFPLVIFPCRASIYSLIYRRGHTDASSYIPESRFKSITICIVLTSLCVALVLPSIELVIGLVGSTIGVAICVMFPASSFRKIMKKESSERSLAQLIFIAGFCIMILGTYANLNAIDEKISGPDHEFLVPQKAVTSAEIFTKPPIDIDRDQVKVKPDLNNFTIINRIAKGDAINRIGKIVLPKNVVEKEPKLSKFPVPEEVHEVKVEKPPPTEAPKIAPTASEIEKEKKSVVNDKDNGNVPANDNDNDKKIITKSSNGIDKDAIQKDEEVAAEEKRETEEKIDDLKRTETELKKTKELLEKKVDELKEEIAKQTKETQNLVAEKLGEVAEKVEQIEREVHSSMVEDEKKKRKPDNAEVKEENKGPDAQKEKAEEEKKTVTDEKAQKSETDAKPPTKDIPVNVPKHSLLGMLTENLKNNSNREQNETNSVYEPLSYKTGELINKIHEKKNGTNLTDNKGPLPLPLLINASQINENIPNQKDEEKLKADIKEKVNGHITQKDKKIETMDESLKSEKDEKEHKDNVESIRREILQVNKRQTDEATDSKIVPQKFVREKRDIHGVDFAKINAHVENANCLNEVTADLLIAKSGLQGVGRDLKSLKTEEEI